MASTTGTNLKEILNTKTIIQLLLIWVAVGIISVFKNDLLGSGLTPLIGGLFFLLLLITIVGASFGVVKEADALATKLGEPYGTLILTLSIVCIEVILITAVLLGPGEFPTIGKDSIFSVMMIIMNLVMGICLVIGGLKYGEQEYNAPGALSYLAMILLLGGVSMVLPNFIIGAGGGAFTNFQAIFISGSIALVYGVFLKFQMKEYSFMYVQPRVGEMDIPFNRIEKKLDSSINKTTRKSALDKETVVRTIVLLACIFPIIILSSPMATVVNYGIEFFSLPPQLGGVLIAIIVFTPESITAIKAAMNNELQRAVNLCHGAFVSTVGLTVPAVLIAGLVTGKIVLFAMSNTELVLFVITLILSLISFLGRRTTPVLGIMHLMIFAVFILLIFNP